MKKLAVFSIASFLAVFSGPANAIDGVEPPEPGSMEYLENIDLFLAMEAACGWGKTLKLDGSNSDSNNTICSGVLVAPNIVLSAAHCFTLGSTFPLATTENQVLTYGPDGAGDPRMQVDDGFGNPIPMYTARFRLQTDGTAGSFEMGDDYTDFYQVPIKRIVFPVHGTENSNGWVGETDTVLLILSDGPTDTDDNGLWSGGWITHIDPASIAPIPYESAARFTGYPSTFGPIPDGSQFGRDRGFLRYLSEEVSFGAIAPNRDGNSLRFDFDGPYPFEVGDSGGITLMQTQAGEFIPCWGVPGGGALMGAGTMPYLDTWDKFFDPLAVYGVPTLYPTANLDVTGDPVPGSDEYELADWRINLDDVFVLASMNSSHSKTDWNGDMVHNINDFKDYISELLTASNPYAATGIMPLSVGINDINEDGRFNIADADELASLLGSTDPLDLSYDYSGNGSIDSADLVIQNLVLTTMIPGGSESLFSHKFYADLDNSGSVDCTDFTGVLQSGVVFDGSIDHESVMYDIRLDYDMDKALSRSDFIPLGVQFLPGDTTTNYSPITRFGSIASPLPDFVMDSYDACAFMYSMSKAIRGIGTNERLGFDVVGAGWTAGDPYIQPDGAYTMSDVLYALNSWNSPCVGSFQTNALLDFDFLDLNFDGRVNIEDMRVLESSIGLSIPELDFNNVDGIIDSEDVQIFLEIVFAGSPFGHGYLGDFDGSASPSCTCDVPVRITPDRCQDQADNDCTEPVVNPGSDCDDLVAMRDTHVGGLDDLFGSNYFYGDAGFIVQLDGDLDGDMDSVDREIVLRHLQAADINLDGNVDFFDVSAFLSAFGNEEPIGDFNGDGSFDFFDINAFLAAEAEKCS